jgi:hypothetical protein
MEVITLLIVDVQVVVSKVEAAAKLLDIGSAILGQRGHGVGIADGVGTCDGGKAEQGDKCRHPNDG